VIDRLSITRQEMSRYISQGKISTFEVEGRQNGRWPVKMKTMVSGWALIDFINYLETKEKAIDHNK